MDLNRVAVFVRVVDEGGFTAAARALGRPKSSVSRAVALLEEELGARLLHRSTRKVALTDAGAVFYERVAPGLAGVEEAREAVAELESGVRGLIRVTAPTDGGAWLLAPVVAEFARVYPEVRVEVCLTGRVVDLVEEGFDFALRHGRLADSSLVARKLATLDLGLFAAPSYLLAHGTPSQATELTTHRCLVFRGSHGAATWALTGDAAPESVTVRGPIDADDFTFLREAAIHGAGIALLPCFIGEPLTPRALVRVLPELRVPGATAQLVYSSARHMPHRAVVFREFVIAALAPARR